MLEGYELTQEELNLIQNNEVPIEPEQQQEQIVEAPPEQQAPEQAAQVEEQQKMVPLKALHEARNEIKALETRLNDIGQKAAIAEQLRAQIEELRAKIAPAEPAKPAMPAFDEDPLEHIRLKTEAQERELARLNEENKSRSEVEASFAKQQQFISTIGGMEREFAKTTPDYQSAVDFLKDFRTRELELYGITDPQTIAAEIANNAFSMAQAAIQAKKNPAEFIYNLAKQYGYTQKPVEAAQAPASSAANSKLATIAAGQQMASKTLAVGGTSEGGVSAESLLSLEGAEFDQAWKKLFGE